MCRSKRPQFGHLGMRECGRSDSRNDKPLHAFFGRPRRMKLAQATAGLAAALFVFFLFLVSAPDAFSQATPQAAPTGPTAQSQALAAPQAAPTTPVDVTQTGGTLGPGFGN